MYDEHMIAALKKALELCDAVDSSSQSEHKLLVKSGDVRRVLMMALARQVFEEPEWEPTR